MSLSFVLTLKVKPDNNYKETDININKFDEYFSKEKKIQNLNEFKDKLDDLNLVGYIQFTYSNNNILEITSLFIKQDERGKGYGLILMIFYLCAFLNFIPNSYYIKKILLDDDSDLRGTTKSIYYLFGFRTKSEPTMDISFFKSRRSLTERLKKDPLFEDINNIIDYFNFLLKKFNDKLININDNNFEFELSNITDKSKIETQKLNIPLCLTQLEKRFTHTRSVSRAMSKAFQIKKNK